MYHYFLEKKFAVDSRESLTWHVITNTGAIFQSVSGDSFFYTVGSCVVFVIRKRVVKRKVAKPLFLQLELFYVANSKNSTCLHSGCDAIPVESRVLNLPQWLFPP